MNPAVNLPTRLAGKAQAFIPLRFRINLAGQAGFGGVHREGRSKAEGWEGRIEFGDKFERGKILEMDKTESEYLRFSKEFDTKIIEKIEERID